MDKVLSDLASWRLSRQQPAVQAEPEPDNELDYLEQNMARERELLDKFSRFEELKQKEQPLLVLKAQDDFAAEQDVIIKRHLAAREPAMQYISKALHSNDSIETRKPLHGGKDFSSVFEDFR